MSVGLSGSALAERHHGVAAQVVPSGLVEVERDAVAVVGDVVAHVVHHGGEAEPEVGPLLLRDGLHVLLLGVVNLGLEAINNDLDVGPLVTPDDGDAGADARLDASHGLAVASTLTYLDVHPDELSSDGVDLLDVAGHDDSSEVVRAGMTPHASSKHLTLYTYGVGVGQLGR